MFSEAERSRRLEEVWDVMQKAGVDAIYLPGNGTVATNPFGCYRYFVNNRVIFFLMSAVLFKNEEPVAVANSLISKLSLIKSSFIREVLLTGDQIGGVVELLKSRGIESGRVGTLLEVLPASWLIRLKNELPNVEFVDVSDEIFVVRLDKSAEEIEVQRACGSVADAGYKAVCDTIKVGMYENEVVAEMDKAMQRMGAEESFALITSGSYSSKDDELPTLHNYAAFNRQIQSGDVVSLEITPRLGGYWSQLVRTICVGEKSEQVDKLRSVIVGAIEEAKSIMKAGVSICSVVGKMREHDEKAGYILKMPCGHIAGIDLNEERITLDNERALLPGMLVILHPTVVERAEDETGIYWGESYIVTEDGYDEIMKSSKELYVSKV